MKERGILFQAEMVKALLAGVKTQTRRIAKLPKAPNRLGSWEASTMGGPGTKRSDGSVPAVFPVIWHTRTGTMIACPYGEVGDRLWVRETWAVACVDPFEYLDGPLEYLGLRAYGGGQPAPGCSLRVRTTDAIVDYAAHPTSPDELQKSPGFSTWRSHTPKRWRSPIHMPRWASRVTLEITEVRAQRLRDISELDARAEGVKRDTAPCDHTRQSCEDIGCLGPTYRASYCEKWDEINGDGSWKSNPWVWALTLKRIEDHR